MHSKKIYVVQPSLPPFEEYVNEIKTLWDTRILTHSGPKHKLLQQQLESFLDVRNVALFANGHLALEIGLEALGISGEVITTPFTFASTTQAILRRGGTPVFCDINDKNYTIDVTKIEALITDKTVAIMPVHVYGNVCDVEAIERIAKKHHLKVIYDAAHAFGVRYKNRGIASYGDISMFSFHATKVFHTIEGGCLCFNDDSMKLPLEQQKDFGIVDAEHCDYAGGNAKMNEFQASMGLCNLRHINEYISNRKNAVEQYRKRLSGVKGIKLLKPQDDVLSNYAYLPVIFDGYKKSRDQIKEELAKHDIGARKYFYPITNEYTFSKGKYRGDTPVAESISKKVLTLPLYSDLKIGEIEYICDLIIH